MSTSSQRPRRNPPLATATKPQPIKATQSFSLLNQGSPAKCQQQQQQTTYQPRHTSPTISSSPNTTELNNAIKSSWYWRRSDSSPDCKITIDVASSSSTIQGRGTPSPIAIHRTGSLDTIAEPYLTSQWPRENFFFDESMHHKATQTGDAEGEPKRRCARSASWGSIESMKLVLRQHRQKSGYSNKSSMATYSPLFVMYNIQAACWPVSNDLGKCIRQSMEGLNQEVQKLSFNQGDDCYDIVDIDKVMDIPDGHKAPIPILSKITIPALTKNVDTQTTSDFTVSKECEDGTTPPSPITHKLSTFAGEPPDGAEKVETVFEDHNRIDSPPILCPDKSKVNINFSPTSPFNSTSASEVVIVDERKSINV